MSKIVSVFIGGGLGSLARYGIASTLGLWMVKLKFSFPLATFTSNVLSCTILSITIALISSKADINPTWRLLIVTGFCGGFSTFSAFSYETVDLLKNGFLLTAFANILISISVSFSLIYIITKN
jgi:CrcB protein